MTGAAWVAVGGALFGTFFLIFPLEFWVETFRPNRKWDAGLPDCPVNPDDKAVVAAVASGQGKAAGEDARLHLASTGKHAKAEEGR